MLELVLFWLLVTATLVFFPIVLLSSLGLMPSGAWIETVLMGSLVCALLLFAWAFVACARDPALDRRKRLRWDLLLVLTGPLGAFLYLRPRLSRSRTGTGDADGQA